MNGIMPGPLWLAIASAASNSAVENRTLTHRSENATVAEKTIMQQDEISRSGASTGHDGETIFTGPPRRPIQSQTTTDASAESEERHGVS
jgi:hypothetical protein